MNNHRVLIAIVTFMFMAVIWFAWPPAMPPPAVQPVKSQTLTDEEIKLGLLVGAGWEEFRVIARPEIVSGRAAGDRGPKPGELVLGTVFAGVARAYPVQVLNYHEMVQDVVSSVPLLISW